VLDIVTVGEALVTPALTYVVVGLWLGLKGVV
jgi:hypothetical protein